MEPIHLFDLAAKQARWLSMGQAVVAANVSNANTPNYKAQGVRSFADVLDRTQLQMASTNPGHINLDPDKQQTVDATTADPWETTESGNSVSLEQEMIKGSDINRGFSLNTGVVKAFHGMLMLSVKG